MRTEPCLCGDPECRRCYPRIHSARDYGDLDDERYERRKEDELEARRERRRQEARHDG